MNDIPETLLEKINEFTSSGFLLFFTNGDNETKHYFHAPDDLSYHALTGYAKHVIKSLDELLKEDYKNHLIDRIEKELSDEELSDKYTDPYPDPEYPEGDNTNGESE